MFTANVLHRTCELIDVNQVRHLLQSLTKDQLNEQDLNKRTALHGHVEILELLLAHDKIDRSIPNIWGQIAEDAASDQVKLLFSNDDNCLIEWFDTYQHAHRITYENQTHLRQWITKVSLVRPVEEINRRYLDQIDFADWLSHAVIAFFSLLLSIYRCL